MNIENETEYTEDVIEVEDEQEEQEEVVEKQTESIENKKIRLERQLAQVNKKLGLETPKAKQSDESDGFGLDVKGYLKASGIKANEFDFVRAELKASGSDIDTLLENEYFQAKLEKQRELNTTAVAVPRGKGSTGVPTDSVEYWVTKPIEEVPQEMRTKVVNARLAKEKVKGVFYNS